MFEERFLFESFWFQKERLRGETTFSQKKKGEKRLRFTEKFSSKKSSALSMSMFLPVKVRISSIIEIEEGNRLSSRSVVISAQIWQLSLVIWNFRATSSKPKCHNFYLWDFMCLTDIIQEIENIFNFFSMSSILTCSNSLRRNLV